MKLRRSAGLAALVAPLLLAATLRPAAPPVAAGVAGATVPSPPRVLLPQSAPTPEAIESAVDGALRRLRSAQREDGSYGGVQATALALVALAESHRGYRADDGPFVARALAWLRAAQAADGSLADEGAGPEARRLQTTTALQAFQLLGADEAAGRAARWLGVEGVTLAGRSARVALELPTDALLDQAATLLATRQQDGGFGDVAATAARANELSGIAAALRSRAAPAAAPRAARALPAFEPADGAAARAAMERGARFLVEAAAPAGRWGFGGEPDAGITAMVAGALASLPEPRAEALQRALDAALDWLVSLQREDGSIHQGQLANYVTSASVLALVAAGREGDRPVVARAQAFLRVLQADEGEGYGPSDRYYGGVGYGGDERPDLSNLQMALEALAASGLERDDEAFQKALVFLQRCQNRSESNDIAVVATGDTLASGDDGGAGYAPGESKAGFVQLADGRKVPRSYGSMTYALLKGYLLAGLDRDDPRVEAAWRWLREHYTLDVNPGFVGGDDPSAAYQGLYYYFLAMARALDLYGEERIEDGAGRLHPWRKELAGRLLALQRRDGSWVNDNAARWYEGNPVLATSYALLTLAAALPE